MSYSWSLYPIPCQIFTPSHLSSPHFWYLVKKVRNYLYIGLDRKASPNYNGLGQDMVMVMVMVMR